MVTVCGNCLEIRICHFSIYMFIHVYVCLYALAGRFFTTSTTWETHVYTYIHIFTYIDIFTYIHIFTIAISIIKI